MNEKTLAVALIALAAACGDDGTTDVPIPPAALTYTTISAGYFHSCGLASSGRAYCWGGNAFGTLGDGTRTTRTVPTPVATNRLFTTLDAGAGHNCALASDGSAYCWGHNDEGQVGNGTFATRDAPVAVTSGLTFTRISAGHAHSCALTAAGQAWCWGDDTRGQLGNGPPEGATKSAIPVRVQLSVPLTDVFAGYYQSCGLAANGDAYCWGANESGQIGDGTVTDRHEPVRVSGGRVFTAISPGDRFVCGVSGGGVWCWGANRYGELGRPVDIGSTVPVQVPGLTNVTAVVASAGTSTIGSVDAYTCAVRSDGSSVCWGGRVRTLRTRNHLPVELDDRIRLTSITAGADHICALSNDRRAFCGGGNFEGQLGDGTRTDRAELVAVHGPTGP